MRLALKISSFLSLIVWPIVPASFPYPIYNTPYSMYSPNQIPCFLSILLPHPAVATPLAFAAFAPSGALAEVLYTNPASSPMLQSAPRRRLEWGAHVRQLIPPG